jgi:peptidoglycan pentaglycine glycine transferase (the first glycine)
MPILSVGDWDSLIACYPEAHIMQTTAWGELKASFGWKAVRISTGEEGGRVGAQVLFRRLPFGYSLAYIPKGPLSPVNERNQEEYHQASLGVLLEEVDEVCRQERVIFLKVEPDLINGKSRSIPEGFIASSHSIQPQRTILVDLDGDDRALLARMKQKTRYNIRLAQKKGVIVRASTDAERFHQLMRITGERNQFGVHSGAYYRRALDLFGEVGSCQLLVAEFEGETLAALMAFAHGSRAWYFYGASSSRLRELMPAYLLQWEAMRWAQERGCKQYDLWGVPDEEEEVLEAQFDRRADGLWGVYRFKRGFGGRLARAAGPWDRVYNPALYSLYRWWMRRSSSIE